MSSSSDSTLTSKYPFFKYKTKHKSEVDNVLQEQENVTEPEEFITQYVTVKDGNPLPWLSDDIDAEDILSKVVFDEKMMVYDNIGENTNKVIGDTTINTNKTQDKNYKLYYNSSIFDKNYLSEVFNIFENITITSKINKHLVTIEEQSIANIDSIKYDCYIGIKGDRYYVKTKKYDGTKLLNQEHYEYDLNQHNNVLTQGSLIILLRQIALLNINRIDGDFKYLSNINGLLYNIKLLISDGFTRIKNHNKYEMIGKGIKAEIRDVNTNEILDTIISVMDQNGLAVYHDFINKNILMGFDTRFIKTKDGIVTNSENNNTQLINNILKSMIMNNRQPKHANTLYDPLEEVSLKTKVKIPLENVWNEDIQLNAMYNFKKKLFKYRNESYLKTHTEFKDILRDFIIEYLVYKPDSIIDYGINYFSRLDQRRRK